MPQHSSQAASGDANPPRPPAGGREDAPTIFISAAEPSADLHGATFIRASHKIGPDMRFIGVSGPAMRDAGCHGLYDMTQRSAMLLSALGNIGAGFQVLRLTKEVFANRSIAAAVFIDSPMLHLPLAKVARRHGVPVFYYIAPQVWAWGTYRVHRVRRRVDKMAVILPFEENFFREHGIDATYVGHPLFDALAARTPDPVFQRQLKDRGRPVVALIPGSRTHVVGAVLPGQLEVARAIAQAHPEASFPVSVANEQVRPQIASLTAAAGLRTTLIHGRNADLLSAADLVLVASGTSTLEAAYYHVPMIVMYNSSRLVYHLLARWLIRTPQLSLVNILAGRELVPEFMPYYTDTAPIARCALELLGAPERRRAMSAELAKLLDPIVKPGAPDRAARLLFDMLDARRTAFPPSAEDT